MTSSDLAAAATLSPAAPRPRVVWLDAARGLAIVAMVLYHVSFDLTFFGWTDWPVTSHPAWRAFAAGIASTFLFLVGVSLAVAHRDRIRWRSFLRRLAILAAAAALVTVGTTFAMPYPITFGILHAVATFSVLALPFLALPPAATLAAAAAVFALPFMWRNETFADPLLVPFGLAPVPPVTFDYEPIFPWLAVTLAGVAFARAIAPRAVQAPAAGAAAVLTRLGRWSLPIYLTHQPLLFALFMVLGALS